VSMVIKAGAAAKLVSRLSRVNLADHLAEARSVLDAARQQAARITADARRNAVSLEEQARKRGYEAGYQQGHREGTEAGHQQAYDEAARRFNEQHADAVSAMRKAAAHVDAIKEDLEIAAEHHLVRFATDVACKLTFAIGVRHRQSATENLRRALRVVGTKTDLVVRAHPNDLDVIRTFAPALLEEFNSSSHIDLVADEQVSPGGCIVRTERSEVDVTLDAQVAEIVALLLGEEADDA
jgi:flagellar assembly protein FliH